MAVRCSECSFVAKEDEGFCPECGAMYVNPEVVDDSEAMKPQVSKPKAPKKKGGLLASLFGAGKSSVADEEEAAEAEAKADEAKQKANALLDSVPRSELMIRCQECEEIVGVDDHEGYCPGCGAFFVEPLNYITQETLAAEKEAQQEDLKKYIEVEKSFEEMNPDEKLAHLSEEVEDRYDQLIRDRHVLNEKANECMQCFTAAGTIKSNDVFEVMDSMLHQRFENLKDFEMLNIEYRRLLDEFKASHDELVAARQKLTEFQQSLQQGQPQETPS